MSGDGLEYTTRVDKWVSDHAQSTRSSLRDLHKHQWSHMKQETDDEDIARRKRSKITNIKTAMDTSPRKRV